MSSIKRSKKIAANHKKYKSDSDQFDSNEESDGESESFEEREFESSKRKSKRIRKRKPKINRKRRRKQKSDSDSESESDQSDYENNNKPKKKRRKKKRRKLNKVVSTKKKIKKRIKAKTIIAPKVYKSSELEDLKVTDLKNLLRSHGFPVSGKKQKLIERLLNPKKTIKEMKLSYHKMTRNTGNTPFDICGSGQRLSNVFRESDYVFINGKVEPNPLFGSVLEQFLPYRYSPI
eukprot:214460_1